MISMSTFSCLQQLLTAKLLIVLVIAEVWDADMYAWRKNAAAVSTFTRSEGFPFLFVPFGPNKPQLSQTCMAGCLHLFHARCIIVQSVAGLSPGAAFWGGGVYRRGVLGRPKLPGGAATRVSALRLDKLRASSLCRCDGRRLRHS